MKINLKILIRKLFYVSTIAASIFLLFFFIGNIWIGHEAKRLCREAQWEYGINDCVEALIAQLDDEKQGNRTRNHAVWALGQFGDSRALPILQKYYTRDIPEMEPLDESISQYELKKAINLAEGGFNITSWAWKWGLNNNKTDGKPSDDATYGKSGTDTGVPLPLPENVLGSFVRLIDGKRTIGAVNLLSSGLAGDVDGRQLWIKQFEAIDSVNIVKIDPSNSRGMRGDKITFKVFLDVKMDPLSADATIPYFGWNDGENIRWITLEKEDNNLWRISSIATGP